MTMSFAKSFTTLAATLAVGLLSVAVFADAPKAAAKAAPNCPFCKMPLGAKKTAKMPIAIKMKRQNLLHVCAL